MGLRERSKARRREAILRAAYELFAQRGFEATTVADIAEVAEVAPRTVRIYFPSKLDMALTHFSAFADRLGTALRQREGETLEAVERWLHAEIAHRTDLDELTYRMLEANPNLQAACTARLAGVIRVGTHAIAQERGEDPEGFVPRMVAVAAAVVINALGARPGEADIAAAMAFLRGGLSAIPPIPGSA